MSIDPLAAPWTDVRTMLAEQAPAAPAAPPVPPTPFADRARTVGHWLRDTGLGITGFLLVLGVALAGWTASFIGLQDFGVHHMGLDDAAAWLVPITFDGAAAGLSLVVFRASIHGRGASVWRLLIVVFTALSAWINWQHIEDPTGRWIASFMPPAAVILFEGLMSEARAAASRRLGRERPRLHPLRWVIDREGTWALYRAYILGIELPDALKQSSVSPPVQATEASTGTPASVDPAASETVDDSAPNRRPDEPSPVGQVVDEKPPKLSPTRRPKSSRAVDSKAPRRSMSEWVKLASPVFHDEFNRLRRNPTASEFADAIKKARLGAVSETRAKSIRTEILDRAELPSLDGTE